MAEVVKIEGADKLQKAFETVSNKLTRKIITDIMLGAAQVMADAARRNARVRTGQLRASFGVSAELANKKGAPRSGQHEVQVFAGPGQLVQAITEEFGTVHQRAHPYMRPAFDGEKKGVEAEIMKELVKAIERIATRESGK